MSSAITAARESLEVALAGQGLRIMEPGASAAPPCVFIVPSDPWLAPSKLGGKTRELSLQLIGLVGTAADKASRLDIEDMAQKMSDAIASTNSPAWGLLELSPPSSYDLGQVAYLAVIGATKTIVMGGS